MGAAPTLGPDSSAEAVVAHLRTLYSEANRAGMARYGIVTDTALGISNTELRAIGRRIKRGHERALALWETDIREARLLAAFTDEKKKVTLDQARHWADGFNSWEIVDGVTDLFVDAGLYPELIPEFAADEREFVRRAAFSMICWCSVHLKKAPDDDILAYLPLIECHASDNRNFVKKAVNWALRSIGKSNANCHGPALGLAHKLAASSDKAERWIGRDAVKELESPKVLARLGLDD